MNQQAENLEQDQRLPSGEWSGFYLENHQPRRGWMHLYINFQDQMIAGEGTDYVGHWVIQGTYQLDHSVCNWAKQYQGKHRVRYQGKITDNGIQGIWTIDGWQTGPFHIWPRIRTDIEGLYLQDEIDSVEPSIILGGVPIPSDHSV